MQEPQTIASTSKKEKSKMVPPTEEDSPKESAQEKELRLEMEEFVSSSTKEKGVQIPDKMWFRIGDVAEIVKVKPYVLRYWESEFPIVNPEKSNSGQRMYRRSDVESLLLIKHLLYKDRYSIEGARRRIREMKRSGQLNAFKRENVLGGEEKLKRKERLQEMKTLAKELHASAKRPVHDLFRF